MKRNVHHYFAYIGKFSYHPLSSFDPLDELLLETLEVFWIKVGFLPFPLTPPFGVWNPLGQLSFLWGVQIYTWFVSKT
jgi:hypothetical protein